MRCKKTKLNNHEADSPNNLDIFILLQNLHLPFYFVSLELSSEPSLPKKLSFISLFLDSI